MIVAGYMEDAVKEKEAKPLGKGYPLFLRLTSGGVRRDNHITEQVGGYPGKITFAHGEGENIGGLIDSAIVPIKTAHGPVTHEGHRQLAIDVSQGA